MLKFLKIFCNQSTVDFNKSKRRLIRKKGTGTFSGKRPPLLPGNPRGLFIAP
jgi:hypothetical protein